MKQHYYIYGSTWTIREDLKAFGCIWQPSEKRWKTAEIEPHGERYMRLKGLLRAVGAEMVPAVTLGSVAAVQVGLGRQE